MEKPIKPPTLSQSDFPITPQNLARKLIQKMDALGDSEPTASNPTWTAKVKIYLSEIANEINAEQPNQEIEVIYSKVSPGIREFLLDVVWWSRAEHGEYMALAAEVEWAAARSWLSKKDLAQHVIACVGEDFGKLIVVKSPIKLLIFCTEDASGTKGKPGELQQMVLDEAERQLRPYKHHLPGEKYVFLDAASNGNRRAWLLEINSAGLMSPLQEL